MATSQQADCSSPTKTEVLYSPPPPPSPPTLVLKLRKTKSKSSKKVVWHESAVDNEDMGKKKSKCCCIYQKPRKFNESDPESDEDSSDCDECHGNTYEPPPK